jgi:hypothetical protein
MNTGSDPSPVVIWRRRSTPIRTSVRMSVETVESSMQPSSPPTQHTTNTPLVESNNSKEDEELLPDLPPAHTQTGIITNSIIRARSLDRLSYTGMGVFLEQQCILCGKTLNQHTGTKHVFIAERHEYRCRQCGKFFYQHNHLKNSCYSPHKSPQM